MSEQDTQQNIGEEAKDVNLLEELEKHWGKVQNISGLSFSDGRKLFLVEMERTYTVRLFNPNNATELQGVQLNIARESMYALTLLYMLARQDERDTLDRPAFWEKLDEVDAEKLRGAFKEIGEVAMLIGTKRASVNR